VTRLRFAAFCALGPCLILAAGPTGGWGFVPAEPVEGGPLLQGTTWIGQGLGHGIWFKHLDDAERLAYLERQTGLQIDPWAAPPGANPRFLTFLVVIENRSDTRMEFNPVHCWLMTNKEEIQTPLSLNDMQFDYRFQGQDLPKAYERVGPVLLDGTVTVEIGEKISGLLVYRTVKPKTKSFTVDTRLTMFNGDVVRFSAHYRRPPKNKEKQERSSS
jgi:hypothetical protein